MKYITLLLVLLFPSVGFSYELPKFDDGVDIHLKFGGWSKHSSSDKFGKYDFNESHDGYGIQLWKGIEDSPWHVGFDAFHMKDSLDNNAKMYSIAVKYEWSLANDVLTHIDLSSGITYHDRSFLETYYYEKDNEYIVTGHKINSGSVISPSVVLSLRLYDRLDIDVTHYPAVSINEYAVTFFRLGIKL